MFIIPTKIDFSLSSTTVSKTTNVFTDYYNKIYSKEKLPLGLTVPCPLEPLP
jgi:hypothetical protein